MRPLITVLSLLALAASGCSESAEGGGSTQQEPVSRTRYLLDQNATAAGQDEAVATRIRDGHMSLQLFSDGRYAIHGELGSFHGDLRGTFTKGDGGSITFHQSEMRGNDHGETSDEWKAAAATLTGSLDDGESKLQVEMSFDGEPLTVHFIKH